MTADRERHELQVLLTLMENHVTVNVPFKMVFKDSTQIFIRVDYLNGIIMDSTNDYLKLVQPKVKDYFLCL